MPATAQAGWAGKSRVPPSHFHTGGMLVPVLWLRW